MSIKSPLLVLGCMILLTDGFGQIVNIEDKRFRLRDSTDWAVMMNVQGQLNVNTQTIWNVRSDLLFEKNFNKHFFLGLGQIQLLRRDSENLLNNGLAHLRYNYEVKPFLVWEVFGQAQYNQQLRIQERLLTGTGLRWKIKQWNPLRIYLGTGAMVEWNKLEGIPEQRNERLASYLSFNFPFANSGRWVSTTYYQPLLLDWTIFRLSSETKISFPIFKKLSFTTTFTLVYDNDKSIPVEVPTITYQWVNGISYAFGRK